MRQAKTKAPLEALPETYSSYRRQVFRHVRLFHAPVAVGGGGGRAFMEASMSTVPTRRSSVTPSGICTKGALRTRVGGVPALPPSRCSSPSCSGHKCQPFQRLDGAPQGHEVRDVLRRQIRPPPVGPQPAPLGGFAELYLKPASGIGTAALEQAQTRDSDE